MNHPLGVMIARGGLAVELGSVQMAERQEEILWLCEAAHVPVTWATQVLDPLLNMAHAHDLNLLVRR
jgi:pyruvate kinase